MSDSTAKKVARFIFNLPLCLLGGALSFSRLCLKLSPVILVPVVIYRWDELAVFLDRPATLGEVLSALLLITAYCSVVFFTPLSECWTEFKVYLSPVLKWKLHLRQSEGGPPFGYED